MTDLVTALTGTPLAAWVPWITAAIAIASALDAVIPQPDVGSRWYGARKILSSVAINFGHAANAKGP